MRKQFDARWLTLVLASYAFAVAVWPVVAGLETTVEDGYYYLKIAENIARGAGSTFDGEHPTNGYHPLWLVCLVPLFALASTSAQALLLAKLLQATMAAVAAGMLYRAARFLVGRGGAVIAVVVWIELTHRLWLQGLEYALHALVLVATVHFYLRRFRSTLPRSVGPYLALGLGCALILLTRLDTLPLTAILAVALWARADFGRPGLRRLAMLVTPVMLAAAAWAAVNLYLFDHATPVSAAVKQSWSETLFAQQASPREHGGSMAKGRALLRPLKIGWGHPNLRPLAFGLTALCAWAAASLLALCFARARRWRDRLRPLAPWACFGALSYLFYVLSAHPTLSLTPRYYVMQPILGAWIAATVVDRIGSPLVRRTLAGALVAALVLATAAGTSVWIRADREGLGQPLVRAAGWVDRTLRADARIAAWNSGTIAFFTGRQVINLDGLVNSWDYFEKARHDVCGYLREQRVSHLVDLFRTDERGEQILPVTPIPIRVPCVEDLELLWIDDRHDPAWSVRAYRVRLE